MKRCWIAWVSLLLVLVLLLSCAAEGSYLELEMNGETVDMTEDISLVWDEWDASQDEPAVSDPAGLEDISLPDLLTEDLPQPDEVTGKEADAVVKNDVLEDFEIDSKGVVKAYKGSEAHVVIPENAGITGIDSSAFSGCAGVVEVFIPDGVTFIGDTAFYQCTKLSWVNIPDSVTSIGFMAFAECESLPGLNIPGSVKSIGGYAFQLCTNLKTVTFDEGLTSIGNNAFVACPALTRVTIPSTVTNIGLHAFTLCSGLNEINVSANNSVYTSIDGILYTKDLKRLICCPSKKMEVVIANGVSTIGEDAFYGCEGIENITVPGSVTSIETAAFFRCYNLSRIYIPASVTSIGDSAFYKDDKLTIYGKTGSYAEQYANANSIPFVDPDKPAPPASTPAPTVIPTPTPTEEPGPIHVVEPSTAPTATPTLTPTVKPTVTPASVTLNKTKASLKVGKKLTLKATLKPVGVETTLTWSSSNKKVATVTQKGVVKAVKPGKATITVKTNNGKKASCKITVVADGTKIDKKHFPDAKFRKYVMTNFDKNKDGALSKAEIKAVKKIDVRWNGIANLKGVELFTKLSKLECIGNKLKNLDLTKNTGLKTLYCSNNKLTSLNLSKNTALVTLYCDNNRLTKLNVSKNRNLVKLFCDHNKLKALDVRKNTKLKDLGCNNNRLKALNVKENTELVFLDCSDNGMSRLDLGSNWVLKQLYCDGNKIKSIDILLCFELCKLVDKETPWEDPWEDEGTVLWERGDAEMAEKYYWCLYIDASTKVMDGSKVVYKP